MSKSATAHEIKQAASRCLELEWQREKCVAQANDYTTGPSLVATLISMQESEVKRSEMSLGDVLWH